MTADLGLLLTRQVRYTQRVGARATEQPLTYDPRARPAYDRLRNTLSTWARVLLEERPDLGAGPADGTPAALARWLLGQVEALRHHATAAQCIDEIEAAVRRCVQLLDRPPDRIWLGPCQAEQVEAVSDCPCQCHAGSSAFRPPCDVDDTDGGCGHLHTAVRFAAPGRGCQQELWAGADEDEITCPICAVTWKVAERQEWLLRHAGDQLMTATELARALTRLALPVRAERVRQWARRGRIAKHGNSPDGDPTYRAGDVMALVERELERDETTRRERPG